LTLFRFRIDPLDERRVFQPNEANSVLHLWLDPDGIRMLVQKLTEADPTKIYAVHIRGCEMTVEDQIKFVPDGQVLHA
jgi:hypothetical protein